MKVEMISSGQVVECTEDQATDLLASGKALPVALPPRIEEEEPAPVAPSEWTFPGALHSKGNNDVDAKSGTGWVQGSATGAGDDGAGLEG